MTGLNFKHVSEILNDYDIFLFDLWGVIIEGNYNYPGVVDNVNHIIAKNKKVFFVTNAPRSAEHLLSRMTEWGVKATKEMIVSSGELTVDMIVNSEKALGVSNPLVYHLKTDENDLITKTKISLTNDIDKANILLLSLYCDEGENLNLDQYDEILKKAAEKKIITLCANPDLGIMQQGVYRYCAGYFAAKVKQFGGEIIYAGKPYPEIYNKILDQFPDIPKKRVLMIGDTFYTDILGANKMGIDSALVLTGNASKFHNQYYTLEEKLVHLKIAATEEAVIPSFIIQLGEKKDFFHK
ncbi:MAG: TIGR01459 family HAD-type hydrolase [Rickettsia endosymbiont of Bryobia graminum]|nr:TIGR01459 family HAD-type hydrolase [Rickettsia endosymbiont of Bryobia graminum]